MKRKIIPLLALLTLVSSCNNPGQDSSSAEPSSEEPSSSTIATSEDATSSESSIESSEGSGYSYSDDGTDDQIMDRNTGEAIEYEAVTNTYTPGTGTNSETYDYDSIYVNAPSEALNDDFMYCVDLSSVYDVETAGGRFYDKDGNEADVFEILKDGGANYVRLRLWVDPYDKYGNSYGGGTNDVAHTIYLSQRAKAAGLKVLVDFHYSDSWADPAKQYAPKAWQGVRDSLKYKPLGTWTGQVLNAFKEAGVTVDAMQIGNETNNGMMGLSRTSRYIADCFKTANATAKSVFPDIKTIVHLTNVTNQSSVYTFLNNLQDRGADDYDIIGLSYYPFWHGSLENVSEVLNTCASTYGKQVMIAETSWGHTLESASFCNNQFNQSLAEEGGYETSIQAQATELADIVDVLSQVPNQAGIGISYWEPSWLPLQGSGWITKYGAYYNDNGTDWTDESDLSSYTDSYCYSSWANQALFSYNGRVLPSAYTYKYIQDGDKGMDLAITGNYSSTAMTGTYDLSSETYSVPSTFKFTSNLDKYVSVDIAWDSDEYNALATSTPGDYTIHGTASYGTYSVDVTCVVTVFQNYISDYSFENQTTLQSGNSNEYSVGEPWTLETSTSGVRVESKSEGNRTGSKYFHWWSAASFTFELSQNLGTVPAGTYNLSTYVLTHLSSEYGGYNSIGLFYQIGDADRVEVSMLSQCAGYSAGLVEWSITNIVLETASEVTIGMYCDAGATSWGHNDDWSFSVAV